jgi:hypothetical protein
MAASNRNRLLPISAIFVRKSGRPDFRAVVPSFVLREPQDGRPSKSAVADFDTLRLPKSGKPDFGGRPPQDEGFQFLHTLKPGRCGFDTSRSAV